MTERPILFSGPMVRAILAGKKTQTRRVAKQRVELKPGNVWTDCLCDEIARSDQPCLRCAAICGPSPYGAPGDRLWVRETHRFTTGSEAAPLQTVRYAADGELFPQSFAGAQMRWRPSIHMPRWASRITLDVEGVRAEPLQEISADDIYAEGTAHAEGIAASMSTPQLVEAWARRWDTINGKRAPWSSNPWVWVVEFRRVP